MTPRDLRHAMPKVSVVIIYLLLLSFALACWWLTRPQSLDDAFIVLAYATELLERGCLCYAPWTQNVAGFTSPLDVLIKAAALALISPDPVYVSWITTAGYVACFVAMLQILLSRLPLHTAGALPQILVALAILSSNAFRTSAAFQLEGALVAFLVVLIVWRFCALPEKHTRHFSLVDPILLLVVALSRPEAVALWAVPAAIGLMRGPLTKGKSLLFSVVAAAILYLCYLTWHAWRFGYPFPNTYYAKRSDVTSYELQAGFKYLLDYVNSPDGLLMSALLALTAGVLGSKAYLKRPSAQVSVALALALALSLVAAIASGGDAYNGARLLIVSTVLLVVISATAWTPTLPKSVRLCFNTLWIALVVAQGYQAARPYFPLGGRSVPIEQVWPPRVHYLDSEKQFAAYLQSTYGEDLWVGFTDFQRLRIIAPNLRVVDLSGLNNAEIAHLPTKGPVSFSKFHPVILLELRPMILVMSPNFVRKMGDERRALRHRDFLFPPPDVALEGQISEKYELRRVSIDQFDYYYFRDRRLPS